MSAIIDTKQPLSSFRAIGESFEGKIASFFGYRIAKGVTYKGPTQKGRKRTTNKAKEEARCNSASKDKS